MLNCRASSWRCVRALQPSPFRSHTFCRDALSSPIVHTRSQHTQNRRNTSRQQAGPKSDSLVARRSSQPNPEPWKFSPEGLRQRSQAKATLTTIPQVQDDNEVTAGEMWLGKRDTRIPAAEWNARKKELMWLKDPLDIAAFVKKELGKGKTNEMLQLVRMASHSMQCTVSWNHIIDHLLSMRRVSNALKVYTEMKKRAQFPDSYTYTILLRGLSNNVGYTEVTSKAIAVYYSMFAPNSRVTPTVIHTNVVLRVCARALDMDALWGVVAKIPQSGPGAADAITYTTILNAIRQSLIVDVPTDENAEEVAARRERGVVEGRRIWEEIIAKWRNADLVIEEDLVCSMARLLLVGSRPRDWDDVLSLVEQTMDIPRLVPRLGSPARQAAGVPRLRAPHTSIDIKLDDDRFGPDNGHKRGDEFLAITSPNRGRGSLNYATPGNNILSALLEACQRIVAMEAADGYWNTITDPTTYAVVPDLNNLNHRLRMLRQNRASTAAVTSLRDDFMAKQLQPTPGTLRIVMSTCVRDKNNHNSLKNATETLNIMLSTFPDADAKTVTMYAKLAMSFPLAKGDDLVNCLAVLQPIVKNLRIQLGVGSEDPKGTKGALPLRGIQRQDAIEALQKIYSIYDRLLMSNLIPEDKQSLFRAERARLSAFMARVSYQNSFSRRDVDMKKNTNDDVETAPDAMGVEGVKDERNGGLGIDRAIPERRRRPWSSEKPRVY